jgi:hypothetical protein
MNDDNQAEDQVQTEQPESGEDFESQATKQGWLPKEDWDGPEDKWVDAKTFVERGESILPILRKNYRELQKELRRLESKLGESAEANKKFGKYHQDLVDRLKKQHEVEVKTLKSEMRQAVMDGDTDKYDQLEAKMEVLQENQPSPEPTPDKTSAGMPDIAQIQQQWLSDGNDWFLKDPELYMYAFNTGEFLARTQPNLTGRAQLDEVTRLTKERFPEKFGNRRRQEPGAVAGGEIYADGGSRRGKKSYDNLPADAKAACDMYVSQGILTKEQFVKDFEWE